MSAIKGQLPIGCALSRSSSPTDARFSDLPASQRKTRKSSMHNQKDPRQPLDVDSERREYLARPFCAHILTLGGSATQHHAADAAPKWMQLELEAFLAKEGQQCRRRTTAAHFADHQRLLTSRAVAWSRANSLAAQTSGSANMFASYRKEDIIAPSARPEHPLLKRIKEVRERIDQEEQHAKDLQAQIEVVIASLRQVPFHPASTYGPLLKEAAAKQLTVEGYKQIIEIMRAKATIAMDLVIQSSKLPTHLDTQPWLKNYVKAYDELDDGLQRTTTIMRNKFGLARQLMQEDAE